MRRLILVFCILIGCNNYAQELNCTVSVNTDQLGATNNQVFKTLETALTDFVNRTDWTGQGYGQTEKILCSMFINISNYNSGQFNATIQVQASRPVFNSTYSSPVFNFNDKDFNFDYIEFQNLTFNPNSFDSNLISVLAFYAHMIIGMDADTFSLNGGTPYFEAAQNIANVAQQSGSRGWSQSDGNQSRYFLINDLLSSTFSGFREAQYQYHFSGLDLMAQDNKLAKENILKSIQTLSAVARVRPNAFLTRVFFDAKSDEIVSIFSGGPNVALNDLVDNLNRMSPINASKWTAIKF